MPTQVARREVASLIIAKAKELGVELGDADLSSCEPFMESIEEFVLKLKPKKSVSKNGSKQKDKSDKETKE